MKRAGFEHTLAPLVAKLRTRSQLEASAEAALLALPFTIRRLSPSQYITREGDVVQRTCVLLEGFAYRQKTVADGGRQIVALQVPGDAVDLQGSLLKVADHNVQALSAVVVAEVPRAMILKLVAEHPQIGHAFWLDTLVDGAIAYEWIANIGRRNSRARLAHLLCECAVRLTIVGINVGAKFELPLTQEQLGDALGLTGVHVNRTVRQLEKDGLIERRMHTTCILEPEKLRAEAGFSPAYLHIGLVED